MTWDEVDRRLREAAQLHALGERLPHAPTPDELAFPDSRQAILMKLREAWRRGDFQGIAAGARLLTREQLGDLAILTYVKLAQRVLQARG
jgi:hypothetical protein